MYLTHLDDEGNDSPAILIENATAANRAVNIPEFVNVAPGGLRKIDGPALEYYRLVDSAMYFRKQGQYEESIAKRKNQRAQAIKGRIALYQAGIPFRETRTSTVRPRTDFEPGKRN